MRRSVLVGVAVAVIAVAAACQGTPRADFNGGAPVVVSTLMTFGAAPIRGADGSTFLAMATPDMNFVVRKLAPDGTVDTSYGDGGDVMNPPLDWEDSPLTGAALADGSLVLHSSAGPQNRMRLIRLDPDGILDPAYGDAGLVEFEVSHMDTSACHVEDSGDATCADADADAGVVRVTRYDALGDVVEERSAPIDFSAFVRPGPPGTASTTTSGDVRGVHRSGDDVFVAFEVRSYYRAANGYWVGVSRADLAVVRVEDDALDPAFGTSGYARVAGDRPAGGVAAPSWFGASPIGLDADAAGAVVFASSSVLGRLTASGALDPAWGDAGLTPVRTPEGAPVAALRFDARAGAAVTVAGVKPGGVPVVLRYAANGGLDPNFSGDGVVELASTASQGEVWGLDVDRGAVTVAWAGADCVEFDQDTYVAVLYG